MFKDKNMFLPLDVFMFLISKTIRRNYRSKVCKFGYKKEYQNI